MKYLAAFLLLGLAGNTSPSSKDIEGVLSVVGIDADEERLGKLLSELEGKDIQQVSDDGTNDMRASKLINCFSFCS